MMHSKSLNFITFLKFVVRVYCLIFCHAIPLCRLYYIMLFMKHIRESIFVRAYDNYFYTRYPKANIYAI